MAARMMDHPPQSINSFFLHSWEGRRSIATCSEHSKYFQLMIVLLLGMIETI